METSTKRRKRLTFVRNRFYGRRANPVREPLKQETGGCNPCFRPSADASKADLAEYHREDMKLRRAHRRDRKPNVRHPRGGKSANPEYRKSIWPECKIARRGERL